MPEQHKDPDHELERYIRKERLLGGLFFVYTYRDAQRQQALNNPEWHQNTLINVISHMMMGREAPGYKVPMTAREETTHLAAGHLAVICVFDNLAGNKLIQQLFKQSGLEESRVAGPILTMHAEQNGPAQRPARLRSIITPDGNRLDDIAFAGVPVSTAIAATNIVFDELQLQLIEEGYDAADWQTLRRARDQ